MLNFDKIFQLSFRYALVKRVLLPELKFQKNK